MKKINASSILAAITGFFLIGNGLVSAQTVDVWSGTNSSAWNNSTLNWDAGASTFTNGDNALFNGTGPTTVTVQASGVTAGDVATTNRTALEVSSGSYTFSGGTITIAGSTDVGIYVDPGATATFNSAIDYTSGNTLYLNVNNGFSGGGTINLTGGFTVGNVSNGIGSNTVNLGNGGTINMSAGNYYGGFSFNFGGAVNITGTSYVGLNDFIVQGQVAVNGAGASLNVLNNGNSNAVEISGSSASVTLTSGAITTSGGITAENHATFSNNGGTATAKGISVTGGGTFNHSSGATYVGTTGITNDGTGTINLSGGIIGASGSWVSTASMKLSNTVTFQAADINANSFSIELDGALTGTGGLIDSGTGGLTLGASNTFTGNLEVVSSAMLTLNLSTALASQASLTVDSGSEALLNYTGTDSIAGLTIDGQSVLAGTYNVTQLNALFGDNDSFAGTGSLEVAGGAVVPEPSTWALMLSGMAFLVFVVRRGKKLNA
jgi:fibronectin-binding autotransporter adhesin